MKIETDGFAFQFTGALDAFRFDELADPHWSGTLAQTCLVLNLERWNANFPQWPVARLTV